MKNMITKGIFALLIAIMMVSLIALPVNAESIYLDPIEGTPSGASEKTQKIAGQILAVVQTVAIAVAVVVLLFVAIKYISAAPNDKAEIKKHMVVYVVGAVVLFAASGILGIIQNFAGIIDGGTSTRTSGTILAEYNSATSATEKEKLAAEYLAAVYSEAFRSTKNTGASDAAAEKAANSAKENARANLD